MISPMLTRREQASTASRKASQSLLCFLVSDVVNSFMILQIKPGALRDLFVSWRLDMYAIFCIFFIVSLFRVRR